MRNSKRKRELVKQAVQEFDISEEPIDEKLELLKQILATQQQILVIINDILNCLPFNKVRR